MRYIYLLVLFVFTFPCFAQQHYSSIQYSMDNGLPQNSVKDILKDNNGYIWMTTENNVLRYDGNTIELHTAPSLSNSHLGDFYGNIHKDSILIFGDLHGKKLLLKNSILKKYENANITRNATDSKGKRYSLFNKTTFIGTSFNNSPDYFIELDKSKYFFNNQDQITYENNQTSKTYTIDFNNLKNVFAFDTTLFIRDLEQRKLYTLNQGELSSIQATDILFSPETKIHWQQLNNQVFLIIGDQLYFGSYTNNELTFKLLIQSELLLEPYHSIYYDRAYNKIYLGSLTKGLYILYPYSFSHVPHNYVAYASLPFSSNSIITPTGLEISKQGVVKQFPLTHNKGNSYMLLYDEYDNILYCTYFKLLRLLKDSQYQQIQEIEFDNKQIKILTKVNDLFAVALSDSDKRNYLNLYKDSSFKDPVYEFRFISEVTSLRAIDKTTLLVGTTNELYRVYLDSKNIDKIQDNIYVKHIIENSDGTYWVTTKSQGFYLLKDNELSQIAPDSDNALLSAHYVLEDKQGFLWISSNNGLFKTSKKHIESYLQNKKDKPIYYRYDTSNGLLNSELNGGSLPNAYPLENSDFVFPSFNGFVIFNPSDIKSYYPKKEDLSINRMRQNSGEIENFKDRISIKSDFHKLEILLDIPYYGSNKNLQLSVKQNDQENWQNLNHNRKLEIFNLKPGTYKYTFRLYTGAQYDYKTIHLRVTPYFYQTKLFYFALILLGSLLVLGIIYQSTKRLYHKNVTLKKQLATEADFQKKLMETISHDITTPLKFISDLAQKLTESNDPETHRLYFDSIHKSSEELYKFTSDMKNYAHLFKDSEPYEICNIFEIVEQKRLLFEIIAKEKNIEISNELPTNLEIKTKKNILGVIIHNILDNAIKYSWDNTVKIKVRELGTEEFQITLTDAGIGMPESKMKYYNNLANCKIEQSLSMKNIRLGLILVVQLIKKLDAKIVFKPNNPKGTSVSIILKINPNEKSTNS